MRAQRYKLINNLQLIILKFGLINQLPPIGNLFKMQIAPA